MTYQGWKNYETWAVKLWIDNEESSQDYWSEAAADHMRIARMYPVNHLTVSQAARIGLADMLKDDHETDAPELTGVYTDLLNAALSEVDWIEIADNLLSVTEGYEPLT